MRVVQNNRSFHRTVVFCLCLALLTACAPPPRRDHTIYPLSYLSHLPEPDITVNIPSLCNCTYSGDTRLHLDSQSPVTVVVHGQSSSPRQFRSLAGAFALHGQQTVCFKYNDRDSLAKSSHELIIAIEALANVLRHPEITVLGHSQGGLVARRAFIMERADRLDANTAKIKLITVSAPFGGIKSAIPCNSRALTWLSLGLIKPLCYLISGDKYKEITPNSEFIRHPGRLVPAISSHLEIITDEAGTCRHYDNRGACVEDDYVFGIDEQINRRVDNDSRFSSVLVKSGHVAIVGNATTAPQKLVGILQREGMLGFSPERGLAQTSNGM